MNIPDAAVYASIAPAAGFIAWTIRMAVKEGRSRKASLSAQSAPARSSEPMMSQLTARDYLEIVKACQVVLNGRYLLTTKFDGDMQELHAKIDAGHQLLHSRISSLGAEMRAIYSRRQESD